MIQTFTTRLLSKTQLTSDVWIYKFGLIESTLIEFIAGQYLILQVEDRGFRNYSILSQSGIKDRFDLLIQIVPNGLASTYLASLNVNSQVIFRGPAGKFTLRETARNKIFLATGTGVAPIKNMIETYFKLSIINDQLSKMYLFWGLRTRSDVYFVDEFEKLSQTYPQFRFKICLSRGEDLLGLDERCFVRGRINPNLLHFLGVLTEEQARLHRELLNSFDYYICGGREVVESVRQYVFDLGVSREQIFFEKF